ARLGIRQHRDLHQHHCHDPLYAVPGHDAGPHAASCVAQLGDVGMVLLAITPLSAAQLMLMVDRYLGGHFFDTQAGGSATLWMHFFWIFGHPEVYVLII